MFNSLIILNIIFIISITIIKGLCLLLRFIITVIIHFLPANTVNNSV